MAWQRVKAAAGTWAELALGVFAALRAVLALQQTQI